MLQQALNFVAPTLLVGGLELGLWNFAASSTQARAHRALAPVAMKMTYTQACTSELHGVMLIGSTMGFIIISPQCTSVFKKSALFVLH